MDYYKIGQRVRAFRRAQDLSQEALAERVGISVTHMSHIETGNTKLSLPVFLRLAQALGVRTDDLLREDGGDRAPELEELAEVLAGCDPEQSRVILAVARAARAALKGYRTDGSGAHTPPREEAKPEPAVFYKKQAAHRIRSILILWAACPMSGAWADAPRSVSRGRRTSAVAGKPIFPLENQIVQVQGRGAGLL